MSIVRTVPNQATVFSSYLWGKTIIYYFTAVRTEIQIYHFECYSDLMFVFGTASILLLFYSQFYFKLIKLECGKSALLTNY